MWFYVDEPQHVWHKSWNRKTLQDAWTDSNNNNNNWAALLIAKCGMTYFAHSGNWTEKSGWNPKPGTFYGSPRVDQVCPNCST